MNQPSDLARYAQLIESMIPRQFAFEPVAESPSHIQVERGLQLPIIELRGNQRIQVVDAGGHVRPVYPALLVSSWLMLAEQAAVADASSGNIDAWIGRLDDGILSALVLATAGTLLKNPSWTTRAEKKFGEMMDHQQSSGAFFPEDFSANPESRWYDELIALHAIAGYAVRANDRRATDAARRCALFHLRETQPDHASAQPWGLLAFARFVPPMADQILHALMMQYPAGVTGVPLLLLNDALYGLRRLIAEDPRPKTRNGPVTK